MALTNKLTAIADAIRGKTGKTAEMTLDQMASEIVGIETGSGGSAVYSGEFIPAENLTTISIDIPGNYTYFVIYATARVTGNSVKATGFLFTDNARPLWYAIASNNTGASLGTVIYDFQYSDETNKIFKVNNTKITISDNKVDIVTGTSGTNLGYFIGGITYKWLAW